MKGGLATRLLSAVFAILVIALLTFYFGIYGLYSVCFFVTAVVIFEFLQMVRRGGQPMPWDLCGLFAVLSFSLAGIGAFSLSWLAPFLGAAASGLLAATLVRGPVDDLKDRLNLSGSLLLGLVYCGLFSAMVISILNLPQGRLWFFAYLTLVFSGDTLAYFVGKAFGKRKLLAPISPKKTVAGAWGGLAGSCLAMLVFRYFFFTAVPLHWLLLATVLTEAFAQAGDLFESLIKRVAGVKDSGHFMPGHGGLMDRVDGLYFAAPVFYLAASYFSTTFAA